jgi:hypothetical protein
VESLLEPADDMRPQGVVRVSCGALAAFALCAFGTTAISASSPGPDAQRTVSVAEAQAGCVPVLGATDPDESCATSELGEIGSVDRHAFVFARYEYAAKGVDTVLYSRVVVFERVGPGVLRTVIAPDPDAATFFEKPKLLRSGARMLLHIPGSESGTGNFNRERLLVWRRDHWQDVDTTSWLEDLARRLPAGHGVWKGVYPDYLALTASTPLWRDGDANACPTGGRADIRLGWHGDAIVVNAIRLAAAGECGEPLRRQRAR